MDWAMNRSTNTLCVANRRTSFARDRWRLRSVRFHHFPPLSSRQGSAGAGPSRRLFKSTSGEAHRPPVEHFVAVQFTIGRKLRYGRLHCLQSLDGLVLVQFDELDVSDALLLFGILEAPVDPSNPSQERKNRIADGHSPRPRSDEESGYPKLPRVSTSSTFSTLRDRARPIP